MKRKRIILILLSLLLLTGAGYGGWVAWRHLPRPLPVRVRDVARAAKLESQVNAQGTIGRVNLRTTQTAAKSLAPLAAELAINETDITRVKVGQAARISVDALQNGNAPPLSGHVREIGLIALGARAKGPLAKLPDNRNFRVVVVVDNPPPAALRLGMLCSADILITTRSNVLTVPLAALVTRSGEADGQGNYLPPAKPAGFIFPGKPAAAATGAGRGKIKTFQGVFLLGADHLAHFRTVKTGIMGDMDVEVLDGLKEGDAVIDGPKESLRQLQEWSWVAQAEKDK